MWKRFFALRFTLFAASHNIRFTTKNQPASRRRILLCPWLQANLSYQSKIEPKQFLTFVKFKALSLQTSIYVRTSNGNRFRRQTIRPLPKRYKLKENCLHSIKITRLLFKWVFLNFECWFSRSLLHYHCSEWKISTDTKSLQLKNWWKVLWREIFSKKSMNDWST